jgi:coenzyme F420 hydrogenase subunit beta
MEFSPNGFLEPTADRPELLSFCMVERYCPAIKLCQTRRKTGVETLYGPLLEPVKTGYCSDDEVRKKASSGGVITAILLYLIDNQLIDGVLQVGKDLAEPTRNSVYISMNRQDLIRNSGSRYSPSSLLVELPAALKRTKKLAVVGKPCDIAGVKNYLENYPTYSEKIALTISFMCMGLPSHNVTQALLNQLNPNKEKITDFWYRGNGWPGEMTVCTATETYSCSYESAWQQLGRATPFRCKICPDGFGEFADISAGDAWFCKNGGPSFENENEGRSFVFIRTAIGQKHLAAAEAQGYIILDQYNIDELKVIQKYQVLRKIYVGIRYLILKKLRCNYLKFHGFCFLKNMRFATPRILIGDIRGFLLRFKENYP